MDNPLIIIFKMIQRAEIESLEVAVENITPDMFLSMELIEFQDWIEDTENDYLYHSIEAKIDTYQDILADCLNKEQFEKCQLIANEITKMKELQDLNTQVLEKVKDFEDKTGMVVKAFEVKRDSLNNPVFILTDVRNA